MDGPLFERLVHDHAEALYRFAFSLTRAEGDARELTQQTFYLWAAKGHQLRDPSKAKSWLFTTLHREFLALRRKELRFPKEELDETAQDLPATAPLGARTLDAAAALEALGGLDEAFQAPVALFYLEDYSYNEIAAVLGLPLGTVKSRISRGIDQLQRRLFPALAAPQP